jgi:membrane-associated phospholipid phosphatase
MSSPARSTFELTDLRVWLLPLLAALAAFIVYVFDANEIIFRMINRLGPASSDWLWANVTALGDTLVALSLCLLVARRRPDLLWAAVVVCLFSSAWVRIHKPLFQVLRPPGVLDLTTFHVIGPAYQYSSFPSGHATTAFAVAGTCVLGFGLRAWAIVPIGIASLIALSRVVVGVHWPIDLLGGAAGGWFAAALGLTLAPRLSFGSNPLLQYLLTVTFASCALALIFVYDSVYPQAAWLHRAIVLFCFAALAQTFWRERSGRVVPGW